MSTSTPGPWIATAASFSTGTGPTRPSTTRAGSSPRSASTAPTTPTTVRPSTASYLSPGHAAGPALAGGGTRSRRRRRIRPGARVPVRRPAGRRALPGRHPGKGVLPGLAADHPLRPAELRPGLGGPDPRPGASGRRPARAAATRRGQPAPVRVRSRVRRGRRDGPPYRPCPRRHGTFRLDDRVAVPRLPLGVPHCGATQTSGRSAPTQRLLLDRQDDGTAGTHRLVGLRGPGPDARQRPGPGASRSARGSPGFIVGSHRSLARRVHGGRGEAACCRRRRRSTIERSWRRSRLSRTGGMTRAGAGAAHAVPPRRARHDPRACHGPARIRPPGGRDRGPQLAANLSLRAGARPRRG